MRRPEAAQLRAVQTPPGSGPRCLPAPYQPVPTRVRTRLYSRRVTPHPKPQPGQMGHLRTTVFLCLNTLSLLQGTGFSQVFTGSSLCPVLLAEVRPLTCCLGEGDGPPAPQNAQCQLAGLRALGHKCPCLPGAASLPRAGSYNLPSCWRALLCPGEGETVCTGSAWRQLPRPPILVPPF